jgi:putative chitinase
MCITSTVGRKAMNQRYDVKTVQILLNLNMGRLMPLRPLVEDGQAGPLTVGAIEEFQRRTVCLREPAGKVTPHGITLNKLRDGMPYGLSEAKLRGIMIGAGQVVIGQYYPILLKKMNEYEINTHIRMAHFLAQIAHESGQLTLTEELASGDAYEGKKEQLGNTQPGDGPRFKGRGLIQLTGRRNYEEYGKAKGVDYATDASAKLLATNPVAAVDVACWFWTTKLSLNALADKDDVMEITKKINGGYNGLEERKAFLARAKFFLWR